MLRIWDLKSEVLRSLGSVTLLLQEGASDPRIMWLSLTVLSVPGAPHSSESGVLLEGIPRNPAKVQGLTIIGPMWVIYSSPNHHA